MMPYKGKGSLSASGSEVTLLCTVASFRAASACPGRLYMAFTTSEVVKYGRAGDGPPSAICSITPMIETILALNS